MRPLSKKFGLDRFGISLSLLCLVHCMITPFIVLVMPVVGQFMSSIWFHVVIVFLVFPIAVLALWKGYQEHNDKRVLWLGAVGLFLIVVAMSFGEEQGPFETVTMIAAGVFLTSAHVFNLRSCRISPHA